MIVAPDYISGEAYAILYGSQAAYSRDVGLAFLRQVGMSLGMPRSPAMVLTVEGTGEQAGERVDVSEAEFRRRLASDDSLWFKAWTRTDSDLLCRFERSRDAWCEHYVIGCLQHAAEPLVQQLLDRFIEETRNGEPELLIIDWAGDVEGFDWADFWSGVTTYDGPMPSTIGIPNRLRSRFHPEPAETTAQELPGHVLLRRTT